MLDKSGITKAENSTEEIKKSLSEAGNSGEQAGKKISKGMGRAAKAASEAKTAMDASSEAAKSVSASGTQAGDKISEGMQKAVKSAKTLEDELKRIGAYQDRLGRWHGKDGKFISIAKMQQLEAKLSANGNITPWRGSYKGKLSSTQFSTIQSRLNAIHGSALKAGFSLKELSPIGHLVTGVYMGVGQAIMGVMTNAINSTIEAGTRLQQLDGRLRSVTKSDAERRALEDKLFAVADNSRSDIDSVGNLYYKVARSSDQTGLNEQQNLDLTETVGKALTVSGASTQEKSATILQLSQALGSGVLQGDELRSLNENASGLMNEMAKYFNTTIGGLKELGRQGDLTSKEVAKAILFAKKNIDEQYEKMPMTISDAMTKIKNSIKKGLLEVEANTGVLSKIAMGIYKPFQLLQQGFSTLSAKVGGSANLIRIMTVAFASLGAAIAYINFSKIVSGIQTIVTAIRAFAVANGVAMGQVMLIAAAIAFVVLVLEDLYTWINGGDSLIGDFLGSFEDFKKAHPWVQTLIDTFEVLSNAIANTWNAMQTGLSGIDFSGVTPALTELAQSILPIIVAGIDLIGKAIVGVIRLGVWLINTFNEFMNSGSIAAQVIQEAFQTMVDLIVDAIHFWSKVFAGDIEGAIEAGKTYFSDFYNHVVSILSKIGSAISEFVTNKLAAAKNAVLGFLGWSNEQTSGAVQDAQKASITINQNISGATVDTQEVTAYGFSKYDAVDIDA